MYIKQGIYFKRTKKGGGAKRTAVLNKGHVIFSQYTVIHSLTKIIIIIITSHTLHVSEVFINKSDHA